MVGKPKTEEPIGMSYDRVLNESLMRLYQLAETKAILTKDVTFQRFTQHISTNSLDEEMKYLRDKIARLCAAE